MANLYHVDEGDTRNVVFEVQASDTVDAYVFMSVEFQNYRNTVTNAAPVVQRQDSANIRLSFRTTSDDTYYFVIFNRHSGFFGLFSKTVGVYSATSTASWTELTTTYTPMVKYRDVTNTVTTSVEARVPKTKYVSLFQLLTGTG